MGTTAPDDTSLFDHDVASGNVGSLNVIVPNDPCANGHDLCGTHDRIRQFDDFLASEVPKIQASPAFGPDGVIFITWDEGSDPPYRPAHVLTAILGPQVRAGANDRKRHDHYGLERTLATGLGADAARPCPSSHANHHDLALTARRFPRAAAPRRWFFRPTAAASHARAAQRRLPDATRQRARAPSALDRASVFGGQLVDRTPSKPGESGTEPV